MAHRQVKYPVATKFEGISVVKYHGTPVVTIHPNGDITLDTGGWRTNTTKHRMNQYAPGVQVYQKNFEWFVVWKGQTLPFEGRTITLKA